MTYKLIIKRLNFRYRSSELRAHHGELVSRRKTEGGGKEKCVSPFKFSNYLGRLPVWKMG